MNMQRLNDGNTALLSLLSSRCTSCENRFWNSDQLYPCLYKHIRTKGTFDGSKYGSVFNIKFSPQDKLALAVCSGKSVVGYDPRMHVKKAVCEITPAHDDCANCITFINSHMFATCSDDTSIRLWDLRNFGKCVQILNGHQNWVKNIEYDAQSNRLFSVAFFEGVREWDLSNLQQYRGEDEPDNLVIKLTDPVRMRISHDSSKMFISMRSSKCCLIDFFDGPTLSECSSILNELLKSTEQVDLGYMTRNRPSIHEMSNWQTSSSFRAIMSVDFHPSSSMAAIRFVDVDKREVTKEMTSMYDLGKTDDLYRSHLFCQQTASKYFKGIKEEVVDDTLDFIKEFCFSPDGRIIASPHGKGVRLLAIDDQCTPMEVYKDDRFLRSTEDGDSPEIQVVNDLSWENSFTSPVLSCRFANQDFILATGGCSGEFLFHQPRL